MKKFGVIVLFLFAGAFSAFADYDKALGLFMQKNYKESLQEVANSLEVAKDADPASPNYKLRYLASQNHRKLGNMESAVIHLQRCAEIQPKSADPNIDLAFIYVDLRKYNDAQVYAQKAVALGAGKNAAALYAAGLVQYKSGVFWRAKEYIEKALSVDPEYYPALNTLGLTLMQLKKYSDANAAFSAALGWYPDTPEFINNLAVCLAKMGKNDEAVKQFNRALELAPQSEQIKKNRDILVKAK